MAEREPHYDVTRSVSETKQKEPWNETRLPATGRKREVTMPPAEKRDISRVSSTSYSARRFLDRDAQEFARNAQFVQVSETRPAGKALQKLCNQGRQPPRRRKFGRHLSPSTESACRNALQPPGVSAEHAEKRTARGLAVAAVTSTS